MGLAQSRPCIRARSRSGERGNRDKSLVASVTTVTLGETFEWTGKPHPACGHPPHFSRKKGEGWGGVAGGARGCSAALREGEPRYTSGSLPTNYKYTGQREETALGLHDYKARFPRSALGRFIQADSLIPGAGNPLAWDRFAYTLNNPVRYRRARVSPGSRRLVTSAQ